MKSLPKIVLAIAIPALVIGAVVDFSGVSFSPEWMVAWPLGVALLGFFILSHAMRAMQDEAEEFEAGEKSPMEQLRRHRSPRRKIAGKVVNHSAGLREAAVRHAV